MSKRAIGLVVAGSAPLALIIGSLAPLAESGLVLMGVVLIWASRRVPRFRWDLLRGAVGGAVAGVAVLGIGLRLAMRVVAVTDPNRRPEFTLEGTMFILIGIGLMLGPIAGAYLVSVGRLLSLSRGILSMGGTLGLMVILFGDFEVRSELTDLGLGGWVNIPMFASVVFAYVWALDLLAVRLERRSAARGRMAHVAVS